MPSAEQLVGQMQQSEQIYCSLLWRRHMTSPGASIYCTHLLAKYKRIRWVEKTSSLNWGRDGFSLEQERKTLLRLEGNESRQALNEAVETR